MLVISLVERLAGRWWFLCAFAAALSFSGHAAAQGIYNPTTDSDLLVVRQLLEGPENSLDFAKVKVTIDHLIDPNLNSKAVLQRLDTMAAEVRAKLPFNPSQDTIFKTLQAYLYQPGAWNANKPYSYDLDDPFGRRINNKLLSTYLATKKGNCISMPMLFLILGQKLGLNVTASTAPLHIFVKYRSDSDGKVHNFEATSGGFKADESYRRDIPMTQKALDSGAYMRWHSKKEVAVLITLALLEHYAALGHDERRLALGHILIHYDPKQIITVLNIVSAYSRLGWKLFISKYQNPRDIPEHLQDYYQEIEAQFRMWEQRLYSLGWTPPDEVAERRYVDTIRKAKTTGQ